MRSKQSGIYTIVNLLNYKCYIGSSVDIAARWRSHRSKLRSRKHHACKLQNSWNLYGENNFKFEILELCSKDELCRKEQHYLDTLQPHYNSSKRAYSYSGFASSTKGKARPRSVVDRIIEGHTARVNFKHNATMTDCGNYHVRVIRNRQCYILGTFKTKQEAKSARDLFIADYAQDPTQPSVVSKLREEPIHIVDDLYVEIKACIDSGMTRKSIQAKYGVSRIQLLDLFGKPIKVKKPKVSKIRKNRLNTITESEIEEIRNSLAKGMTRKEVSRIYRIDRNYLIELFGSPAPRLLTAEQRKAIVSKINSGSTQASVAREFSIDRHTVRYIVRDSEKETLENSQTPHQKMAETNRRKKENPS